MTPRAGLLLGLLAAAACSRPAPPVDEETRERAAFLAAYESGFMTSCVDAALRTEKERALPTNEEAAKAACGCAWPTVREGMLLTLRPATGIDALNYKVRTKALLAEETKFAGEFFRSEEGRDVVKRCAIRY